MSCTPIKSWNPRLKPGMRSFSLHRITCSGECCKARAAAISYTWDGGNRMTRADDSIAGTISRSYDGLDRLTQEQTPSGSVGYTYDNADRRATMAVTGQSTVNYADDNANRLSGITQGTSSVGFAGARPECSQLPTIFPGGGTVP